MLIPDPVTVAEEICEATSGKFSGKLHQVRGLATPTRPDEHDTLSVISETSLNSSHFGIELRFVLDRFGKGLAKVKKMWQGLSPS